MLSPNNIRWRKKMAYNRQRSSSSPLVYCSDLSLTYRQFNADKGSQPFCHLFYATVGQKGFSLGTFTGKTESILVVDSNHAAGDELSALIRGMSPNYVVQRAGSGCEAIRMSENGLSNIILAAEELSDMTGYTFFDIVKCLKKQTPCILLSKRHDPLEKTWAGEY